MDTTGKNVKKGGYVKKNVSAYNLKLEKAYGSILKVDIEGKSGQYHVGKEDCEFKDILVENKGEQWISELYISATEYSITILYKRGGEKKKCLIDI